MAIWLDFAIYEGFIGLEKPTLHEGLLFAPFLMALLRDVMNHGAVERCNFRGDLQGSNEVLYHERPWHERESCHSGGSGSRRSGVRACPG